MQRDFLDVEMKIIVFSLILISLLSCSTSSYTHRSLGSGNTPKGAKPGKCYAKCVRKSDSLDIQIIDIQNVNAEWFEVLCKNDLTNSKLLEIHNALAREGFTPKSTEKKDIVDALIKYQTQEGLPIGSMNIVSLKKLGVE